MSRDLPRGGGRIDVIRGPMFSAKTEDPIRRLRRAQIARWAVDIVKPETEDRAITGRTFEPAREGLPDA